MIVSPYTHNIDRLIVQLYELKNMAKQRNEKDAENWIDLVIEIVKEWKYDNSQWDYRENYYRQAVSFLLRVAEETPEDEQPEYFEARFFDTMRNYRAIEKRYKEREGR